MKIINNDDLKLLDYPEAELLNQDTRIRVDSNKGSLYSFGKSFLMEERESDKTNEKISTVRVDTGKTKNVLLDIVHGSDEDIKNLFCRVSRYETNPNKGIIFTILPVLAWIIGFMLWFSVYEGMIKKRIPLMTTTTITIISLTGVIAFILTIVIMLYFGKEDTFVSNMAVTGESTRMINYYFEGKLDSYEATVYEGFLWNQTYNSKRIFNLKLMGSIFGELEHKRRVKVNDLKSLHAKYLRLDSELEKIPSLLKSKRDLLSNRNKRQKENIDKDIKLLEEKQTELKKQHTEIIKELREERNDTILYIKTLNTEAIEEWKKNIKSMGMDNTLKMELKQILRTDERIIELEQSVSKYKVILLHKQEGISAMMEVNVESGKSIKDVALTGSENTSTRLKMMEKYKDSSSVNRLPIDWNSLIKQIVPWVAAIILGVILVSIINTAKDMSKLTALIWIVGILLVLTIIASLFTMIVNSFRGNKQPQGDKTQ